MNPVDLNRLYNDAEPLVREQVTNWLKNNGLAVPADIQLDSLTHSISFAFAMKIQAQFK